VAEGGHEGLWAAAAGTAGAADAAAAWEQGRPLPSVPGAAQALPQPLPPSLLLLPKASLGLVQHQTCPLGERGPSSLSLLLLLLLLLPPKVPALLPAVAGAVGRVEEQQQ